MRRRLLWLFVNGLLIAGAAWVGYAQGKKSVTSKGEFVRFENDRVRVVEFILQPGVAMGVHNHPRDRVEINIAGSRVRVTQADGKTSESDEKEGAVTFSKASPETHDVVNIGKTPLRAYHVELK